jgi:hypothetical protein
VHVHLPCNPPFAALYVALGPSPPFLSNAVTMLHAAVRLSCSRRLLHLHFLARRVPVHVCICVCVYVCVYLCICLMSMRMCGCNCVFGRLSKCDASKLPGAQIVVVRRDLRRGSRATPTVVGSKLVLFLLTFTGRACRRIPQHCVQRHPRRKMRKKSIIRVFRQNV